MILSIIAGFLGGLLWMLLSARETRLIASGDRQEELFITSCAAWTVRVTSITQLVVSTIAIVPFILGCAIGTVLAVHIDKKNQWTPPCKQGCVCIA